MFENDDEKIIIWRSRLRTGGIMGKRYIYYYEDLLLNILLYGMLAFVVSIFLLWQININIFIRPPNPNFIGSMPDFINANPIIHLQYWAMFILHGIPIFHPYKEEIAQYRVMGSWLAQHGLIYVLTARILIALAFGVIASSIGISSFLNNPRPSDQMVHRRGMRVLTGKIAQFEYFKQTKIIIKKTGVFCEMAKGLFWSNYQLLTHTIGIGASGTGKSQFLEPHIRQAMASGLKVVILDPKYEFTQALYDENNPSHAILDPTDARSHVWDMARDINTISKMRRFANSFIPPGEGDAAMWSNSARMLFVGAQIFLFKKFKNYTPKDITDIFSMFNSDQYYHIMKNYFPSGLDAVGQLGDDGKVEDNVTNYGVKLNLKGFIDGLVDLGRFWNNPKQKKISLFKFMTDPNYPIKTIFIKPNDDERLMSSGIIRSMLNYMISLLDTPHVTNASKPRGVFFLDEFQAPGPLRTEDDKPTINKLLDRGRSKGWGAFLFVQDILQLWNEYTENEVEQWRAVASQFVLTGTPPGKTAQMVSDMIGKEFFDKSHQSHGFENGRAKAGDVSIQEHEQTVILPTEISAYLTPTNGNIRFMVLGRGLKDTFIFEKPIVPLVEVSPAWIEQVEDTELVNINSRVVKLVEEEMIAAAKAAEASADMLETQKRIAESNDRLKAQREEYNSHTIQKHVVEDWEDDLPTGEDIVEEEPINLNDDDEEEIVLYDPSDDSQENDSHKLMSLVEMVCEELKYDSDHKDYLSSLVLGDVIKNWPLVTEPILINYSDSPLHQPLIERIRAIQRI